MIAIVSLDGMPRGRRPPRSPPPGGAGRRGSSAPGSPPRGSGPPTRPARRAAGASRTRRRPGSRPRRRRTASPPAIRQPGRRCPRARPPAASSGRRGSRSSRATGRDGRSPADPGRRRGARTPRTRPSCRRTRSRPRPRPSRPGRSSPRRTSAARDPRPPGTAGRAASGSRSVRMAVMRMREAVSPTTTGCGTVASRADRIPLSRPPGGTAAPMADQHRDKPRSSSSTTSRSATTCRRARTRASRRRAPSTTSRCTVPAGKICVLVGPVGLRQDDVAEDGQPADRADLRPDPHRRRRRRDARADRAPAEHRLRDPADRPVPAPDDRRERRDGAAAARLAEGPAPRAVRGAARRSSGSIRRSTATATRRQLSGGERQRVGVARALAADPPIMLMDEPFGAVDPIVRDRLQNEFLRLQETIAKTILFVTHDIDEAIKMGDLVAVFQTGGILAQFGPPPEILAAPASEFVARFVGADRGLKRLSLLRVADVAAAAGDDRVDRRCRRGRPATARRDDPHRYAAGRRRAEAAPRLGRPRRHPGGRHRSPRDGQPDLADRRTSGRRSRTRCR